MTGFVLRSAVVSGWPGLEVKGYTDATKSTPCELKRFDRVAPTVLLCIFKGVAGYVTIAEPAEALHFGVKEPSPDAPAGALPQKDLRYVDGPNPGTQVPGVSIEVMMRTNGKRVIDVAAFAPYMHAQLIANSAIDPQALYTAAEFALEMIQGVQEVDFTMAQPPKAGA
jgi:hypothetical protein